MHGKIRLTSPNNQTGLVRVHSQTQQSEKKKKKGPVASNRFSIESKERKAILLQREREREKKVPVADKGP